jgi:predicted nuclease of predicted toxin-antitoxin system
LKVKLDENLPSGARQPLVEVGHDVDSAADEGLDGASDARLVERATSEGRLVITLDRGLGDVRKYVPGDHAGVIVLRLGTQSLEEVDRALRYLASRDLEALAGAVVVYRDGELRVRWPTPRSDSGPS